MRWNILSFCTWNTLSQVRQCCKQCNSDALVALQPHLKKTLSKIGSPPLIVMTLFLDRIEMRQLVSELFSYKDKLYGIDFVIDTIECAFDFLNQHDLQRRDVKQWLIDFLASPLEKNFVESYRDPANRLARAEKTELMLCMLHCFEQYYKSRQEVPLVVKKILSHLDERIALVELKQSLHRYTILMKLTHSDKK